MCAKNKIWNVYSNSQFNPPSFIRSIYWDDNEAEALKVAATLLNRKESELTVVNTGLIQEKCGHCSGQSK